MRVLRGAVTMGLVACAAAAVPSLAAAQAPVAPTPLPAGQIAPGVSIAGIQVGGQFAADARQNLIDNHVAPRRAPLLVTFRGRNLKVEPVKAGYVADVDYAVKVALIYGRQRPVPAEGVDVPLKEKVNRKKLRAILALRARANDLPAQDAAVSLKGVTPVFRKPRIGLAIDVPKATTQIAAAIVARDRTSYALASHRVLPARTSVGAIVVIDRGNFRLTWYKGKRKLSFPIAVGQPAFPTPTRRLLGHPEAGEPHLVPAELAVGRRPGAGAAGREQPAGDALDRHVRAGDRHARHAGLQLDRHPRVARLHPDVHLRRREALPAG